VKTPTTRAEGSRSPSKVPRRKYEKPVLEKVKIERDLSLRMATCACNHPSPFSDNCW